jgi:hypothetical protein
MKKLVMAGLLTAALLLIASGVNARPVENTTVNAPFAFSVGTLILPAGTYKIELTTQATAGKDPVEVVLLRSKDQKAYASFVGRVGDDQGSTAGMTFQRVQGQEFLTEIRTHGKLLQPLVTPEKI